MLLDGVKYSFQLLGDFSVSTENTTIHLRGLLGNQLSSLFAYFLCNHTQSVDNVNINFTNLDRLIFTNLDQLSKSSKTSLTL